MIAFSRFWRLEFSAGGGPFTRGISQRLGAVLAYAAQHLSLTPNRLTTLGLACYLLAAAAYAFLPAGLAATLTCLLLYQLALGLDCSDGQLARATAQSSEFGAWWDVSADAISSLCLVFALLYWLASRGDALTVPLTLALLLLAIGRTLALYSSKSAGAATGRGSRGATLGQPVKWLILLVIDTPTLLLMVCVLRDATTILPIYVAAMGALFCLNAGYLGVSRLKRA